MRRRVMRADGNHYPCIDALKRVGVSVADTHRVGTGFPDLVWGCRQVTGLLELKLPGAELEAHQREWHDTWRGAPVLVARSPEEAVELVLRAARSRA